MKNDIATVRTRAVETVETIIWKRQPGARTVQVVELVEREQHDGDKADERAEAHVLIQPEGRSLQIRDDEADPVGQQERPDDDQRVASQDSRSRQ